MMGSMLRRASLGDGSTLSLDFTQMSTLADLTSAGLTFSRSTSGTYINANGLVATATAGNPRFDHDPTTLSPRGLLIEGSGNNTCTYSGDMTQSGAGHWSVRTALITTGWTGFTAPDNTASAVKIIPDTTSSRHTLESSSTSIVSGTVYTASVFVKSSGYTVASLVIAGGQTRRNFTLSGAGTPESQFGLTNTATITPVGNDGWYRITVTWTANATGGAGLWIGVPQNATTDVVSAWSGNGTSGILAWGAQLEAGSGASSYIPTGASTGNRAADVCYMDGTNFSSWYNASTQTGTLFADITHSAQSGANSGIELGNGLGNQVSSNRVSLRRDAVIVDGVSSLAVSPTGASQRFKTAIAFAPGTGNTAACRNGGTVSNPAQAAGTLTGINALKLYVDSTLYPYGWIRQVKVWPINLANATLQAITTI